MDVLAELRARFVVALAPFTDAPAEFAAMVKQAQDTRFGDYQANCAMPLAKQQGVSPRDLATRILERLDVADFCEPPEIAGPGFINLRLRSDWLERLTTGLVADSRLGVPVVAQPRNIIIDYSAPNVAKPMHVGHLRSSVIGAALYNILKFLGHQISSDNHIGDWGTQFGMIIYGYKHFLDRDAFALEPVRELARLYRLVNQLSDYHDARVELPQVQVQLAEAQQALQAAEAVPVPADKAAKDARQRSVRKSQAQVAELKDSISSLSGKLASVDGNPELKALADAHPQIAVQAREETARLHAGDETNRELWAQFIPQCLAAIQKMYDRLGIAFDMTLGESFYQPFLAEVVADLQARGIAVESDGAICVFLPDMEAPFIIRKRDGAFTYATTDLATIKYRVEQLGAEVMLYVVDARQGDHFKMLFETARRAGFDRVAYKHVSFGTILGEDKRPFKTRSGDTVGLESLIDESIAKAREIVDANDNAKPAGPELDEAARARIAEVVGIGAIKYADLSQNRETDYVFSYDKMLAVNGDTATYMQYAYARVCGIFRKGGISRDELRQAGGQILLGSPAERALALQLNRFSEVLDQAGSEHRPNFLTQYLFATANSFSTFFDQCPVLKAETPELRTSRLLLADLTARVVAQGLELLGIQVVEQM